MKSETRRASGWRTKVLSTAASYKQMDHAGRGVCVVRYRITLQPGGVGIVQKPAYSLINFMNDLGSASAILGIGYSLLAVWQKMTSKLVKKEDGLREKLDKLRERRRAVGRKEVPRPFSDVLYHS